MRPSSGGSSRMSNWLEPACAREAMATARPAMGTVAAAAVPGVAAAAAGAVWLATMPKFGRPSVAAFAAFHPLCADGDPPASDADAAASASTCVAARRSATL